MPNSDEQFFERQLAMELDFLDRQESRARHFEEYLRARNYSPLEEAQAKRKFREAQVELEIDFNRRMEKERREHRGGSPNAKIREMRNRHRLYYEATAQRSEEERRVTQSNRRVFDGEVISYSSSTRTAKVQLPQGNIITGRVLGRGSPVGAKVNITIPLGSAIATIMTPEPKC